MPPIVGAVLSGEQENGGSIRTEEVAEMADAKGTGKAAGKVELIQTLPEVFAAKDRAMKAIDEKKGFHTEEDEQNWFDAAADEESRAVAENDHSVTPETIEKVATEKALKMALEDEGGGRSMTEGSGGGSSRLRMR